MKIIGLLTAWACEDWIELSIKQALELVDELIIAIGAFDDYFKKIEDKTLQRAKKYFDNDKIKVIETTNNPSFSKSENKCATLNHMIQVSDHIQKGNILWILDSDEFYSEDSVKEIMDFIKINDFDEIRVHDRFFCINLNYYLDTIHGRILKIKASNPYFTPTQKIHPRPKKVVTLLKKNPMFHYSLLTGEQIKGLLWMSDNFIHKFYWYRKIYLKYDPNKEQYWMEKNRKITGHYGFWFDSYAFKEKNNHGLFKYNGQHPTIIENSPLKEISDFRIYMKKKPNYEIYRQTMIEIIEKKRTEERIRNLFEIIKNTKVYQKIITKLKSLLKEIPITKKIFRNYTRQLYNYL